MSDESSKGPQQAQQGLEHDPPPEGARNVVVNVKILDASDPDDVKCELSSPDEGIIGDGRLIFKNDHHPGFVVKFHLTNTDEYEDYVFPSPDPNDRWQDAIWSTPVDDEDDPCPHLQRWRNFRQLNVLDGNKSVLVHNPNPCPPNDRNPDAPVQLFKFALRFARRPGGPVVAMCDPIGENQNGSYK